MDKTSFATGMAELAEAFRCRVTELGLKIYYSHLSHFTNEQWREIVHRAIGSIEFSGKLPTVAQLVKIGQPPSDPLTGALDLWDDMMKLKRQCLVAAPFDYNPETGAVYEWPRQPTELERKLIPNWQRFCTDYQDEWAKKAFVEAYRAYTKDPHYAKQLPSAPVRAIGKGE